MNESRSAVAVEDLRILDENAAWLGISPSILMEAAGEAVAKEMASRMRAGSTILVLCGSGNNGGDGIVAARRLSSMGYRVILGLTSSGKELEGFPAEKYRMISNLYSVSVVENVDAASVSAMLSSVDGVIVALVGTGIKGPLREPTRSIVEAVNSSKAFKLAVDVPAGIDPDSGERYGTSLNADLVVTMHAPKLGLIKGSYNFVVADIGIPKEAEVLVGPGDVRVALHKRKPTAKKGESGRLLIIGGGKDYSGAPSLAALGAMRVGVDLVAVAAPYSVVPTIRAYSPAMIVHPLPGDYLGEPAVEALKPIIERYDAVVFGMGIGREQETMAVVPKIIELIKATKKPFLVDADALRALPKTVGGVLTPHAGEFAAMAGFSPHPEPERGPKFEEEMQKRISDVVGLARSLGSVILLKGKYDVITDGEKYRLDGTGNPGMAVGGVGDVLSGVIGAFLSWGNDAFKATCAGSFVTGVSGDMAVADKGYHILATDVIEGIPKAFAKYWPGY